MADDRPAGEPIPMEFWPDYGGALVWARGERVALETLPLPGELIEAATVWLAGYDDMKLPWEPTRDDAWLDEGRRLYEAFRDVLWAAGIELVPSEDFWRAP